MRHPPIDEVDLGSFAPHYDAARHQFLAAYGHLSMERHHRCLRYPGQGPAGETLSTDVCWIGPADATRVLVVISGTHGIEGFAGSAIQTDLLRRQSALTAMLEPDIAICLIHALNPFGFAWLRRVNEDGIDLNRNFIDFSAGRPSNPGYDTLAGAIVPHADDWSNANVALLAYLTTHGQRGYERAVSGGQYHHPQGLFYGGIAPSAARLHIEQLCSDYAFAGRTLAVIDIHTGLGPHGYGEVICDHPPGSPGLAVAQRWFGDLVTSPEAGTSSSVPKAGLLDYHWHGLMNDQSAFVTLEFGTYSVQRMFEVLRHDHHLHRHGDIAWDAAGTRAVKQAIRQQFYPDTRVWNAMVLFQGRQAIAMALEGLQNDR